MTAPDEYLGEVHRAMGGMDPRVRDDILRELRSHLAEAASANGGDMGRAIAAMGPAAQVGREYRALYGYGIAYQVLFVVIAAVLSALTIPVLQGTTSSSGLPSYVPSLIAFPFLVLAVLWLLWVSVRAGSRVGLYSGAGACAGRIAAFAAVAVAPSGGIVTLDGLSILVLSSVLLILVGALPGTAKKAWSHPVAEL